MNRYFGHKVLVTGGTGFIGGRLAERLAVEEGARVRVLVHDWRKAAWVSRANIELIQGAVTEIESLGRAIQGCDTVFHCVGVGGTYEHCKRVNVDGTRNVIESAISEHVEKIVYLSTIAVHGPNPPDNANEKDEFRRFGTPYGDSKIAAEELVWSYRREKNIPVAVIRPTFIWGPGSPSFTIWPIQLMKANRWFLIDNGKGTCHANYIDNLVDAILLAGIKKEAIGEAFLLKDDPPCTWSDFFGYYARMVGRNEFPSISSKSYKIEIDRFARKYVNYFSSVLEKMNNTPTSESARTFSRGMRFGLKLFRKPMRTFVLPFDSWDILKYSRIGRLDTSKISNLLGYHPRISRENGMKETESWLRNQNIL